MINYVENIHKRNSSNIISKMDIDNFYNYSTPIRRKEKTSEVEMEMRRTYKPKPPLLSSKFPAAFEIARVESKKLQPIVKIKEDNNENNENFLINDKVNELEKNIRMEELRLKEKKEIKVKKEINENKINLKLIKLKTLTNKKRINVRISTELKTIEYDNKIELDFTSTTNKKNKFVLKPIEIKDPRRIRFLQNKDNKSAIKNSPKSLEKHFAKTSMFNFKFFENINLNNISTHDTDISKLEKNLKLKSGDIIKNISYIKNLQVENEEKSKMLKSTYINNDYIYKEPKFKLEEMITIGVINKGTCGNIIKKLHVPTLRIYTVREIPLINKEIRNTLTTLLSTWKNNLSLNKYFNKIYSDYINSPEGYTTIIMQQCSNGSLENLITSCGRIPENILKQIAFRIFKSLEIFYVKTGGIYGSISPNNILFDSKGNVKLSIGLKQIFFQNNEQVKNKFKSYDVKMRSKLRILWTQHNIEGSGMPSTESVLNSSKVSRKLEMFDLGYLLIKCALGGVEIYDLSQYTCQHIDNENDLCCCFYHCLEKYENVNNSKKIKIINLINNKLFSTDFITFLCDLTSYHFDIDYINKIKNHNWLNTNYKDENILINITELLKVSNSVNKISDSGTIKNTTSNLKIEKLIGNISLILPAYRNYYKQIDSIQFMKIFNSISDLEELSNGLNLEKEIIIQKIKPIYDNLFNY